MDGRGTSMITVYINGDPAPSQFIKSGEQKSVNFNVSERDSIAIEFRCRINTGCGDVHFFDATFYDHHFNMNPNPMSATSSAQPQPPPTIIPTSQNPKTPSINLTYEWKKNLNITDLLSCSASKTHIVWYNMIIFRKSQCLLKTSSVLRQRKLCNKH